MSPKSLRVFLTPVLVVVALVLLACKANGPGGAASAPSRELMRELSGGYTLPDSPESSGNHLPPCRPGSDELWIFAEGPRDRARPQPPEGPGGGSMVARNP